MTSRIYIVETVNAGSARCPKYFGGRAAQTDPNLNGIKGRYFYYGRFDQCLVYVKDIDPAHEAYLQSLPDVLAVPADLNTIIAAGQVANIRTQLAARNIPGGWINAGDTYRRVIRETMWVFDFLQRYTAFANFNPLAEGIDLNTTLGAVVINQWGNLLARYLQALTEIDPDTITPDRPEGTLHTPYSAWHNVVTVEALAQGMSQNNIHKCAALVVLTTLGFNISGAQSSTTFNDILSAVGNNRTGVPYLWAGASEAI